MKRLMTLLTLLCLLLASGCAKKETAVPAETAAAAAAEPAETAGPAETPEKETDDADASAQEHPFLLRADPNDPAPGYILVQGVSFAGLLPLPAEGEYTRAIRQVLPDGSESLNIVRVTPEGFVMADADCPGRDCVEQGEVTLSNMADRVLWNMVICAPHYLTLSLLTKEEAVRMAGQ